MDISLDGLDWIGAMVFGLALLWPLVAGMTYFGRVESNLLRIDQDPATAPKGFADIVTFGLFASERSDRRRSHCR